MFIYTKLCPLGEGPFIIPRTDGRRTRHDHYSSLEPSAQVS